MFLTFGLIAGGMILVFVTLAVIFYYSNKSRSLQEQKERDAEFENLTQYFQQVLKDPNATSAAKRDAAAQIAQAKIALRKEGVMRDGMMLGGYGHGYGGYFNPHMGFSSSLSL